MLLKVKSLSDFSASELSRLLPQKIETRVQNKANAQAKRQSLAAYCLLLELLEEEFGIINPDICYTDLGKPYLPDGPYFSISHCEDYVAVAISRNPIGVDIEKIRDFNSSVLYRFFSDSERSYILKSDSNKRFFTLWTLKEAVVKEKGTGIKDLSEININITCDGFYYKNLKLHTECYENYVISACFSEKTDF